MSSLLRLEPIGAAASKEYSLEKNLEKMKADWVNMCFSFVKYRDTVSPSRGNSLQAVPCVMP
jgi:hypothetical protein